MSVGHKCIIKDCKNYAQAKSSLCLDHEAQRQAAKIYRSVIRQVAKESKDGK